MQFDDLVADLRLLERYPQDPAATRVAASVGARIYYLYDVFSVAIRIAVPNRVVDTDASAWTWTRDLVRGHDIDHVTVLACTHIAGTIARAHRRTGCRALATTRLSYADTCADIEHIYYDTLVAERRRVVNMDADTVREVVDTARAHVGDLVARATSRDVLAPAIMDTLDEDVRLVIDLLTSLGDDYDGDGVCAVYRDELDHFTTALRDAVAAADVATREERLAYARERIAAVHEWLREIVGAADGVECAPTRDAAVDVRADVNGDVLKDANGKRAAREETAPRKRRRVRAKARESRASQAL